MAEILAADAQGDSGTGRLHGSAAIIELIRGFLDNCGPTQHLLGNVVIDVDGDAATRRAYIHDVHLSADANSSVRVYTLGDYRDTWQRCANGTWCLTERVKSNRAHVGSLEVFGK